MLKYKFKKTQIKSLYLDRGSLYGINVMFKSTDITGKIVVNDLKTISCKNLPNNFRGILK